MAGCATCAHKNVHPNVCSDCLGGTHFKPRLKTNADRIRAMTDEELAGQIEEWNNGDCPPFELCPKRHNEFTHYIECAPWKCWLDWLKQEADDADN